MAVSMVLSRLVRLDARDGLAVFVNDTANLARSVVIAYILS